MTQPCWRKARKIRQKAAKRIAERLIRFGSSQPGNKKSPEATYSDLRDEDSSRYHPDYPLHLNKGSLTDSQQSPARNVGARASLLTFRCSQDQLGNQIALLCCPGSHHPPVLCSSLLKKASFPSQFFYGLVTFKHKPSLLSTKNPEKPLGILHKITIICKHIFYFVQWTKIFDF